MKLLPHLLCWAGIVLVLLRGCHGRRMAVTTGGCAGFILGMLGAAMLLRSFPGDFGYSVLRDAVGGAFLMLLGVAVAALYRSTGGVPSPAPGARLLSRAWGAVLCAASAGAMAGAIAGCRLAGGETGPIPFVFLGVAAVVLTLAVLPLERAIPEDFAVAPSGVAISVVALLILSSSSITRLDLFAPLTMKLMKFVHDFVHQFFESMLIPDHFFIRSAVWEYIGLLFGREVGFWGALLIFFIPVVLVLCAVNLERLPSVGHIRQGAQRRKILASALAARRRKLLIPACAALFLAGGVYRSLHPTVQYWDPKPLPVSANAAGEIVIPLQGEVEVEDGQLHKYLFQQRGRQARFFVLMTPEGKLAVALDACAICRPDGYGQGEGTVLCYYCKTLIPLATVGKPGGCNPVPVPFRAQKDGVHLDAMTLLNTWESTVQSTTGGKGGEE